MADWIAVREPAFTEADLTNALDDRPRNSGTVSLSAHDRSSWDTNCGITAQKDDVSTAAAANVVAVVASDSTALTAEEVAQQLSLSTSNIRHCKAAGRLYS